MILLLHSFAVLMAFIFTMLLKSFFTDVIIPLAGILTILYAVLLYRKKNKLFNISILISLILTLVVSTGDISSPLFFLLYFLGIGISLAFDPRVVFVYTIGLIFLFFPLAFETDPVKNLFVLFSFIMLSPLAYLFGRYYHKNKEIINKTKHIKRKHHTLQTDIEKFLYNDEHGLKVSVFSFNKALEQREEAKNEAKKSI